MSKYVVIGTHLHSHCPGANGTMRTVMQQLQAESQAVAKKHGVRPVAGPLHLDPARKIVIVAEAPSAEAVRDFLMESRLAEVQAIELYLTTPLERLLQQELAPLY